MAANKLAAEVSAMTHEECYKIAEDTFSIKKLTQYDLNMANLYIGAALKKNPEEPRYHYLQEKIAVRIQESSALITALRNYAADEKKKLESPSVIQSGINFFKGDVNKQEKIIAFADFLADKFDGADIHGTRDRMYYDRESRNIDSLSDADALFIFGCSGIANILRTATYEDWNAEVLLREWLGSSIRHDDYNIARTGRPWGYSYPGK